MKAHFFLFFFIFCFSLSAQSFTIYRENGKVGLKDHNGRILIPARYDDMGWSDGNFSVLDNVTGFKQGRLWGLIKISDQPVTSAEYESVTRAGALIVVVKKNTATQKNVSGCINASGKTIIPFLYDGIELQGTQAIVFTKIGNQFKFGVIDLENKTLIPQQYQDVKSVGSSRFLVRNFEGKSALFSRQGQQVTPFDIDSVRKSNDTYTFVYQGKNVGLLDAAGNVKIPVKYRDIDVTSQLKVREADEWLFLTGDNRIVRSLKADSIIALGAGRLKVKTAAIAELMDKDLNVVGGAVVSDIGKFSRGRALYELKGMYGLMMTDGRIILPAIYHEVVQLKDFIVANQRQGNRNNWILFDSVGVRILTRSYDKMLPIAPGYFSVKQRGHWGVIDRTGREIVACVYDSLLGAKDNTLLVRFKGLNGIISFDEKWKVAPRNSSLTLIDGTRYLEYNGQTTFLREMNGNTIYFTQNRIELDNNFLKEYLPSGNVWKIDMNGSIVDRQYVPESPAEEIFEESEGYRAIKRNGRYGFIDSRGRLRIANRYEAVKPFKGGFAAVKILGKWGFIDIHDNLSAQPVYDEVESYVDGFALVRQKDLFGLIDRAGKVVLPVRYQYIRILPNRNLHLTIGGQQGLADATGRILIQPRFDTLIDTGNGYAIVSKQGKSGLVNYNGVATVPQVYDYIAFDKESDVFMAMKKAPWTAVP